MTDVKYLPTFKIGEDIVVFPWKELRGDTHEEAMSRLNPFEWERENKRLWLWMLELPISPTGETICLGGGNSIRYYDYKVEGWRGWLIGGENFDRLEKENTDEDSGVQARD